MDYYPEGTLIWLDADVKIRQLSQGNKSLDDFCHAFLGGPGGAPALKTYNFDDVVADPQCACSRTIGPASSTSACTPLKATLPLGGVEGSGWKLVYDSTRSDFWKSYEDDGKMADLSYSIGLKVKDDGTVDDVAYGGPAQKAGIAPAVKVIAVNRRQFSLTVLREAVAAKTPDRAAGQDRRVLRDPPRRLSRWRTLPPPGARYRQARRAGGYHQAARPVTHASACRGERGQQQSSFARPTGSSLSYRAVSPGASDRQPLSPALAQKGRHRIFRNSTIIKGSTCRAVL